MLPRDIIVKVKIILDNKVLVITPTVWVIVQGIKVTLAAIREKKFNFKWLIGTGGMPSSHAAGATALATTVGLDTGCDSVSFALAFVFAMVTMFDAQGVRRSVGQLAVVFNQIVDDIYWRRKTASNRLIEFIGHTPLQVIIGAILGFLLSYILYNLW